MHGRDHRRCAGGVLGSRERNERAGGESECDVLRQHMWRLLRRFVCVTIRHPTGVPILPWRSRRLQINTVLRTARATSRSVRELASTHTTNEASDLPTTPPTHPFGFCCEHSEPTMRRAPTHAHTRSQMRPRVQAAGVTLWEKVVLSVIVSTVTLSNMRAFPALKCSRASPARSQSLARTRALTLACIPTVNRRADLLPRKHCVGVLLQVL